MPFASISALAEILGWKVSTLLTVTSLFQLESPLVAHSKNETVFISFQLVFVIWEFGFSFTLVNRQRRSNTHRIRYKYPTWQYFSLFHSYLTLIFLTKEIDPSTAAHTGVCGDRCSKRGYTKYKLVSPLQFVWRQCLIHNENLKIVWLAE